MFDAIFPELPEFSEYFFYLALPAIVAPFVASALFWRTYPTRRAVWAFSAPIFASFLLFVADQSAISFGIVFAVDAFVVLTLLVDWASVAFIRENGKIVATRTTERIASLAQPHDVELTIENRLKRSISVEIADDSSPDATAIPPRTGDLWAELATESAANAADKNADVAPSSDASRFGPLTIAAGTGVKLTYRLIWNRRGEFSLENVALRVVGFLGFWSKYLKIPCESTFRVYPNICQLAQFETLARASRLHLLGLRRTRTIGQDDEFECLRDYTLDDQYKFIDWKATAKRNKLIVRDFQASRNQRIMLMIDAGRMTANRSRGVTLFDSALNSALALAYVALKQGDEVGCLIFSNETRRYVAPRGGASQMNALICGVYDIFPERVESRYDRAFAYLEAQSSKRSLVVLATNVLDERNAEQIERNLTNFVGKHLPLGLFFRERSLFDPIERFDDWEKKTELADKTADKNGVDALDAAQKAALLAKKRGRLGFWFGDGDGKEPEIADEIESLLSRQTQAKDATPDEIFYRAGAAAEILNWRRRTLRRLEAKGALTLDVFPEDATAPLINKYLEIKARRLL